MSRTGGRIALRKGLVVWWTWFPAPLGGFVRPPGEVRWRIEFSRLNCGGLASGWVRSRQDTAEAVAKRAALRALRRLHGRIEGALGAEGVLL